MVRAHARRAFPKGNVVLADDFLVLDVPPRQDRPQLDRSKGAVRKAMLRAHASAAANKPR